MPMYEPHRPTISATRYIAKDDENLLEEKFTDHFGSDPHNSRVHIVHRGALRGRLATLLQSSDETFNILAAKFDELIYSFCLKPLLCSPFFGTHPYNRTHFFVLIA